MRETQASTQPWRPAGAVGQLHAFFVEGDRDVADFHGEAVGALVDVAVGKNEAATEAGAGGDEEHPLAFAFTQRVFAVSGRVAVVGHEDGAVDFLREFFTDVHADPILGKIGFAPDDAIAGGSGNVEADGTDVFAEDAGLFLENRDRGDELLERLAIALVDVAADLGEFRRRVRCRYRRAWL